MSNVKYVAIAPIIAFIAIAAFCLEQICILEYQQRKQIIVDGLLCFISLSFASQYSIVLAEGYEPSITFTGIYRAMQHMCHVLMQIVGVMVLSDIMHVSFRTFEALRRDSNVSSTINFSKHFSRLEKFWSGLGLLLIVCAVISYTIAWSLDEWLYSRIAFDLIIITTLAAALVAFISFAILFHGVKQTLAFVRTLTEKKYGGIAKKLTSEKKRCITVMSVTAFMFVLSLGAVIFQSNSYEFRPLLESFLFPSDGNFLLWSSLIVLANLFLLLLIYRRHHGDEQNERVVDKFREHFFRLKTLTTGQDKLDSQAPKSPQTDPKPKELEETAAGDASVASFNYDDKKTDFANNEVEDTKLSRQPEPTVTTVAHSNRDMFDPPASQAPDQYNAALVASASLSPTSNSNAQISTLQLAGSTLSMNSAGLTKDQSETHPKNTDVTSNATLEVSALRNGAIDSVVYSFENLISFKPDIVNVGAHGRKRKNTAASAKNIVLVADNKYYTSDQLSALNEIEKSSNIDYDDLIEHVNGEDERIEQLSSHFENMQGKGQSLNLYVVSEYLSTEVLVKIIGAFQLEEYVAQSGIVGKDHEMVKLSLQGTQIACILGIADVSSIRNDQILFVGDDKQLISHMKAVHRCQTFQVGLRSSESKRGEAVLLEDDEMLALESKYAK